MYMQTQMKKMIKMTKMKNIQANIMKVVVIMTEMIRGTHTKSEFNTD